MLFTSAVSSKSTAKKWFASSWFHLYNSLYPLYRCVFFQSSIVSCLRLHLRERPNAQHVSSFLLFCILPLLWHNTCMLMWIGLHLIKTAAAKPLLDYSNSFWSETALVKKCLLRALIRSGPVRKSCARRWNSKIIRVTLRAWHSSSGCCRNDILILQALEFLDHDLKCFWFFVNFGLSNDHVWLCISRTRPCSALHDNEKLQLISDQSKNFWPCFCKEDGDYYILRPLLSQHLWNELPPTQKTGHSYLVMTETFQSCLPQN